MKKKNNTPPPEEIKSKGFKIFDSNFQCRGFQFAENTRYKENVTPKTCSVGFHYCTKASDCFSYYEFDPSNIICEVIAYGQVDTHLEDSKQCTNDIFIGKRLTWAEVLVVANQGSNNTGHSNSGDRNSGNWNSGNWNSGNWNSGNRNSGDRNSGDRNSGDRNSGDSNSGDSNSGNWNSGNWNSGNWNSGNWNSGNRNSGNWNSGNWNSGNRNSGNWNSGDRNSGDRNSGDRNSGNWNSGDSNSGDRNSGNWNSGNWNSGNWNSGNWNSGNRNSGNWNSGDRNSGDRNSGNWNSGDRNSGDSNSGYRNSGAFCTDNNPYLILFNKQTKIRVRDWESHPACQLMNKLDLTIWVPVSIMTDAEKAANPKHEAPEGYLKTISHKEAWANMWHNLDTKSKNIFTSLENFDAKIFEEITGIKTL
jgi:hypothetical protein